MAQHYVHRECHTTSHALCARIYTKNEGPRWCYVGSIFMLQPPHTPNLGPPKHLPQTPNSKSLKLVRLVHVHQCLKDLLHDDGLCLDFKATCFGFGASVLGFGVSQNGGKGDKERKIRGVPLKEGACHAYHLT